MSNMADDMADTGCLDKPFKTARIVYNVQVRRGIRGRAACRNRTDDLFITSEQMVPLGGAHGAQSERETEAKA